MKHHDEITSDLPTAALSDRCLAMAFLAAMLFLASAAASWADDRPAEETSAILASAPVPAPAGLCAASRWVGLRTDAERPCPMPDSAAYLDWQVEPLFASPKGELPVSLQPFCLYRADAGESLSPADLHRDLQRLVRFGELSAVDPICGIIEAHETAGPSPADKADRPAPPPVVRLAILGTQPTGQTEKPGRSEHGFALARMIEKRLCTDLFSSECGIRITPRLALPLFRVEKSGPSGPQLEVGIDHRGGGYFGSLDHLARAIWDEVEEWKSSGEAHLVMNLSLGWAGERLGGLEERVAEMPVPVRTVYRAVEAASCQGALIVAASGNREHMSSEVAGPLLPAAWERRTAPSKARCAEIRGLDETSEPVGPAFPEPLVYAAGGVRDDGTPLANARPRSEPTRVAFADHVVIDLGEGRLPEVLTGSSVAAAEVSASAALAWRLFPELDRHEVMETVEEFGHDLGRKAAAPAASSAPVRRVGVCSTLTEACRGGECEDLSTKRLHCSSKPAARNLSKLREECSSTTWTRAATTEIKSFNEIERDDQLQRQNSRAVLRDLGPAPQPSDDPCAGCTLDPPMGGPGVILTGNSEPLGIGDETGYRLWIQIDSDWTGPALERANFFVGENGIGLDHHPFQPGECVVVDGFDPALFEPDADGIRPATYLRFQTPSGWIESPVFLAE